MDKRDAPTVRLRRIVGKLQSELLAAAEGAPSPWPLDPHASTCTTVPAPPLPATQGPLSSPQGPASKSEGARP